MDTEYTHELSLWKHRVIRSYVLRQKQEVDIYALAAAKQHIQEIVAHEFAQTRKGRGRKTAARFLDIGTASPPSPAHSSVLPAALHSFDEAAAVSSSSSQQERDATGIGEGNPGTAQSEESASETNRSPRSTVRSRGRPRRTPTIPSSPTSPAEPDVFDTKGWGGDFNLPQHASQQS